MEMRPIGNSGIGVAPVALGGNVFDWTAATLRLELNEGQIDRLNEASQ